MKAAQGFTLIELMVAISIVAILATMGFSTYTKAQSSARDSKRVSDLQEIAKALEQYKAISGTYVPGTTTYSSQPCYLDTNNGSGYNDFIFNSGSWGVSGSSNGCPASISHSLSSYFANIIPEDPLCPKGTCTGSWADYDLFIPPTTTSTSNPYACSPSGSCYLLCAKLENVPSTNPAGVIRLTYNYCLKSQQ